MERSLLIFSGFFSSWQWSLMVLALANYFSQVLTKQGLCTSQKNVVYIYMPHFRKKLTAIQSFLFSLESKSYSEYLFTIRTLIMCRLYVTLCVMLIKIRSLLKGYLNLKKKVIQLTLHAQMSQWKNSRDRAGSLQTMMGQDGRRKKKVKEGVNKQGFKGCAGLHEAREEVRHSSRRT